MEYDYEAAMCYMPFSISFIGDKPFWKASVTSSSVNAVTSTPKTFNVNTVGSAYVRPIITITAGTANTVYNFSLENATTNEVFS